MSRFDVILSRFDVKFLRPGFSKLNAAIGIALDINNDQMEGSVADKMAEASSETSTSASVTTWQRLKPEEWSSPVDACVNSILDFCDTGEAFVKHPSAFFQHRLLCAEMLLTLIDQLKQLGDVDMAGLGPDFGPNLIAANTRAKVKLASMHTVLHSRGSSVHFVTVNSRQYSAERMNLLRMSIVFQDPISALQ